MTLNWVNKPLSPLRDAPGGKKKYLELPMGALVEPTGNQQFAFYGGMQVLWTEVMYHGSKQSYQGWIYDPFIEPYVDEFPGDVVPIPNATPDPTDAAQYLLIDGRKKYNMCGQLAVCYIAKPRDVVTFLEAWKSKAPNFVKRIWAGEADRGTDLGDLDSMLSVYDYAVPCLRLNVALRDPILGRPLVTPGRLAALVQDYQVITSVHIDGISGNLRGSGVLHWVVLEKLIPDGINRGWVELYNPFPNRMQRYSWDEMIKSMGSPYGICVERSDADL